jgi:hypothetical protein
MTNKVIMVLAIFIFVVSSTGYAQNVSLGLKASTLGAGMEAEGAFSDSLGARIGVNYFSYDRTGTEDDIEYDFDITLMSVSALLDWHPFKGTFRISGGALFNGNNLDAEATSAATYDIGDTTYTASQIGTLDGEIDFNDISPYLGLGWDTTFGKKNKFGFIFELGVLYQDSPEVNLSASGPISSDQTFQSQLVMEEENLQKELDEYKYYPVVAIGFSYRF